MADKITHPFPPVYDENSKIIILGSFPSVKSREVSFYYGNQRNRFFKVVSSLLAEDEPKSVEEKKKMLLSHGIALWDVVKECKIVGSSDTTIKDVVPNDVAEIISRTKIKAVFTNGGKATELYKKYLEKPCGLAPIPLPSTSPANASASADKLISEWEVIKDYL